MTKAQQILALYDGHRTTTEIAEIVGCGTAYVRTVARQRKGSGRSAHDRRYLASDLGKVSRKRVDRAHYERFKAEHGVSRTTLRLRNNPEARARDRARCLKYYYRKKAERGAAHA
jgi:hypothetical protein